MPLSRPANPKVNPTGESIEPAPKPERVEQEPQAPRVSAILVGYNQAPALRRAVKALENSRDRDKFEILVVDCGSADESTGLDTDFPAINMLRLPHHLGAARAMNIAIRTAKAELLFFVSPDVEVAPVEQLVRDAQRAAQPQTSSWSSMLAMRQQTRGCVGSIFQGAGVVTIIILVLALVGNLIHH